MIIVDVIVPSIGRKYNFSLDEETSVALLTEEIRRILHWNRIGLRTAVS